MATVDGKRVTVGEFVCFKRGIEQFGKIVKITGDTLLIEVTDEYDDVENIQEHASRCWIE